MSRISCKCLELGFECTTSCKRDKWNDPIARKSIVSKIENSLGFRRKFKSKASAEFLENEVFAAAKDKIEYVSLLSRLFHELESPDESSSSVSENQQIQENKSDEKLSHNAEEQNENVSTNQEKQVEDSCKSLNPETGSSKPATIRQLECQLNSPQLESVITQVIEWTLKSSGKDQEHNLGNQLNTVPNPGAAQISNQQSTLTATPGRLKIANVQSINKDLETLQRSSSLPSVSHVQNLVNPPISNTESFANQPQRLNLLSGPHVANSSNLSNKPEAMLNGSANSSQTPNLSIPTTVPQLNTTNNIESFSALNEAQWRKHAKEALFKGIEKLEEDVYKSAGNKEKYYQFFRDIFRYAENSKHQNITKHNFTAVHGTFVSPEIQVPRENEVDKLKRLLASEPPQVQIAVMNDWAEIDSHLKSLLTVKGPEVDQPSKDIKLLPDEFEMQIDNVLRKVTSSNVPS